MPVWSGRVSRREHEPVLCSYSCRAKSAFFVSAKEMLFSSVQLLKPAPPCTQVVFLFSLNKHKHYVPITMCHNTWLPYKVVWVLPFRSLKLHWLTTEAECVSVCSKLSFNSENIQLDPLYAKDKISYLIRLVNLSVLLLCAILAIIQLYFHRLKLFLLLVLCGDW